MNTKVKQRMCLNPTQGSPVPWRVKKCGAMWKWETAPTCSGGSITQTARLHSTRTCLWSCGCRYDISEAHRVQSSAVQAPCTGTICKTVSFFRVCFISRMHLLHAFSTIYDYRLTGMIGSEPLRCLYSGCSCVVVWTGSFREGPPPPVDTSASL